MNDVRLTVRLSPELSVRLRAAAGRKGVRESDLVRLAVEHELAEAESAPAAFDRMQRAGLIGTVHTDIPDLSTNPRHMVGFGR